ARVPVGHARCLGVRRTRGAVEGGHERFQVRVKARGESDKPVRQLARGNLSCRVTQVDLKYSSHIEHRQQVTGGSDEALPGSRGMSHRPDVQVSDVAHVDDAEEQTWASWHSVQQASDQLD